MKTTMAMRERVRIMTTATAAADAMMMIRGGAEEAESGGKEEGRGEAGMVA